MFYSEFSRIYWFYNASSTYVITRRKVHGVHGCALQHIVSCIFRFVAFAAAVICYITNMITYSKILKYITYKTTRYIAIHIFKGSDVWFAGQ